MKTIYFATYGHTATSWLWNCLFELGIRVDGEGDFTFEFDCAVDATSSRFTRRFGYDHLASFLPAFTFKTEWVFRNDVFVYMTGHRLPPRETPPRQTILFVRDPRDVLMTMHRWEVARHEAGVPTEPLQTDFMAFARSHLAEWIEFHEQALDVPELGVFRFEEYKLDAVRCLTNILEFCGLVYSPADIMRAVAASTVEMTRRSEYLHLCSTPPDQRHYPATFNQSGQYLKWRTAADSAALDYIVASAKDVMRRLGYFDEAGAYTFTTPATPTTVRRVSLVADAETAGVPTQRGTAGDESLEAALVLTRAGTLGAALLAIERGLVTDPDDVALLALKLDLLFRVMDQEPRYLTAYAHEAIRTFYVCANRDVAVLARHGRALMQVLEVIGDTEQLRALLADWDALSKQLPTASLVRARDAIRPANE